MHDDMHDRLSVVVALPAARGAIPCARPRGRSGAAARISALAAGSPAALPGAVADAVAFLRGWPADRGDPVATVEADGSLRLDVPGPDGGVLRFRGNGRVTCLIAPRPAAPSSRAGTAGTASETATPRRRPPAFGRPFAARMA